MSESEQPRADSRLELDDPQHCKDCGAHLGLEDEPTDDHGRPMTWIYPELDWESVEICKDCWAEEQLDALRHECMARYNGELSGVLTDHEKVKGKVVSDE